MKVFIFRHFRGSVVYCPQGRYTNEIAQDSVHEVKRTASIEIADIDATAFICGQWLHETRAFFGSFAVKEFQVTDLVENMEYG